MARGIGGKAKKRVENLIAWLIALGVVGLMIAGGYYLADQSGVV